jgi:hypothetical protein
MEEQLPGCSVPISLSVWLTDDYVEPCSLGSGLGHKIIMSGSMETSCGPSMIRCEIDERLHLHQHNSQHDRESRKVAFAINPITLLQRSTFAMDKMASNMHALSERIQPVKRRFGPSMAYPYCPAWLDM